MTGPSLMRLTTSSGPPASPPIAIGPGPFLFREALSRSCLCKSSNVGTLNALPNPSNGKFIVELRNLNNDKYSFEIRNILGQLVYTEMLNGNAVQDLNIDLTENEKGIYLLTISNSEGTRTEKLVIY